jgi:uncharacterized membrane protein
MRFFSHTVAITFLTALACASIASAQPQPQPSGPHYKFSKPINYPNAIWTFAYAINDEGQIVGYYYDNHNCNSCGFSKVGSQFTSIYCTEGIGTTANAVSNKGEVVGGYVDIDTDYGFILQSSGSCLSLNPFNSGSSAASGVNDDGDIVGYYSHNGLGNFQGFLYANGNYTNVACEGWPNTFAFSINDAGVIVGAVENSDGSIYNAFVYKSGKCSVFSFRNRSTLAWGINKQGQISGYYLSSDGSAHGWVKTGKKFATLDYPAALATSVGALNDKGQVAGAYEDSTGAYHGFVATPKKK